MNSFDGAIKQLSRDTSRADQRAAWRCAVGGDWIENAVRGRSMRAWRLLFQACSPKKVDDDSGTGSFCWTRTMWRQRLSGTVHTKVLPRVLGEAGTQRSYAGTA